MAKVEINFNRTEPIGTAIDITDKENVKFLFQNQDLGCSRTEYLRYLKGIFTNFERFQNRFLSALTIPYKTRVEEVGVEEAQIFNVSELIEFFEETYEHVSPYTYQEAFSIENDVYRTLVFGSINIGDMIENLGSERISVEGIEVKRKKFSDDGTYIGETIYDNIYELYKVNGEKLNLRGDIFAVKCWCTSTNKEHWLWIEEQYATDPLTAIASTFRIHEDLIPNIKELKRHGDILLCEFEKDVEVNPTGNVRPLTKDEYFNLLTCES